MDHDPQVLKPLQRVEHTFMMGCQPKLWCDSARFLLLVCNPVFSFNNFILLWCLRCRKFVTNAIRVTKINKSFVIKLFIMIGSDIFYISTLHPSSSWNLRQLFKSFSFIRQKIHLRKSRKSSTAKTMYFFPPWFHPYRIHQIFMY